MSDMKNVVNTRIRENFLLEAQLSNINQTFSRNDKCFKRGKLNFKIQIENLQAAKENLIEVVKTSKMKMNACQDELKEENSMMKELDTNIDSCIHREEESSDERSRFSTKLNKCRIDKRRIKINCKDNSKLNQTMHEMYV
ncbi:hypothetical protein HHI36_008085 [Cryptolaemus montrouzieri]|uniref:Uncharacterized protein n=1 Tax=Cryptolaemus montrouzieri TaxID=559131 RepID=A0ABD2MS02_9CUCU